MDSLRTSCKTSAMRILWLPIVCALLLPACGRSSSVVQGRSLSGRAPDRFEQQALLRARAELQCELRSLVVGSFGGGGYRVDGCGRFITYTCVLTPGGFRGRITCMPATSGVLAAAPTAPAATPVAPASYQTPQATEPSAAPATPPATPSAAATGAEVVAARAAIAALAPSVLACTEDVAIALDMTWDASGSVTVTVVGPSAGTSVQECVRAALAAITVSPAGEGGHVRAAVQR